MTFRLLSCDGGGIRGYLSSSLIQALDTATSGKFLASIDGYAGTSTGSLIAIALARGIPIGDLVGIYKTEAATIFTKSTASCPWLPPRSLEADELASVAEQLQGPGYTGSQYTSSGLREVLSRYLGAATFGDLTGKLLAVNSAQLWDQQSPPQWSPTTFNNKKVGRDYSAVQLIDAALASSAAPAYFPLHEVPGLGYFADGGTYANNPVLNGIEVALTSGAAASLSDIQVLSFGTGLTPQGIPPGAVPKPACWGVISWMYPEARLGAPATPLLNLTLDLSSQNLGAISERILGDAIVRINPQLSKPVALDEYTKADYAIMDQAIAAAQNSPEWTAAIKMVEGW